jgi:hypothetical protein
MWRELLPAADQFAAPEDILSYLTEKYGAPKVETGAGETVREFKLEDRTVSLASSVATGEIVGGWQLLHALLCALAGPPGFVTATAAGSASFVPLIGSSVGALGAATTLATAKAGVMLWQAINRGCVGRCPTPPCQCRAIPLVPPAPTLTYATTKIMGIPVVITVTASITLSALLVCV